VAVQSTYGRMDIGHKCLMFVACLTVFYMSKHTRSNYASVEQRDLSQSIMLIEIQTTFYLMCWQDDCKLTLHGTATCTV